MVACIMTKCPLCDSSFIIFDLARGEYYCGKCGYVVEQEQVIDRYSLVIAQRDYENAGFVIRKAIDEDYEESIRDIRRIAANLGLHSHIIREAEAIFSELRGKGLIQYRHVSRESLTPVCLLVAARKFNYDLSFEDVYTYANEEPDKIRSTYFKYCLYFYSQ